MTLGQAVRHGDLLDPVVQRAVGAFAMAPPVAPDLVVDSTAHVLKGCCAV